LDGSETPPNTVGQYHSRKYVFCNSDTTVPKLMTSREPVTISRPPSGRELAAPDLAGHLEEVRDSVRPRKAKFPLETLSREVVNRTFLRKHLFCRAKSDIDKGCSAFGESHVHVLLDSTCFRADLYPRTCNVRHPYALHIEKQASMR
jgi:hypothetical protein